MEKATVYNCKPCQAMATTIVHYCKPCQHVEKTEAYGIPRRVSIWEVTEASIIANRFITWRRQNRTQPHIMTNRVSHGEDN